MEAQGRAFAMPEESLSVSVRRIRDVAVIDLKGRLIMGEAVDSLNAQVRSVLGAGTKNLAINLGGVSYVDSSGIACMVDATTSAQAAGAQCKFFAASSRVLQLVRITRLDNAFIILADEDSALSSF
jgi:anti-sigma B factor antagonist